MYLYVDCFFIPVLKPFIVDRNSLSSLSNQFLRYKKITSEIHEHDWKLLVAEYIPNIYDCCLFQKTSNL
jgi:hypothetical protein